MNVLLRSSTSCPCNGWRWKRLGALALTRTASERKVDTRPPKASSACRIHSRSNRSRCDVVQAPEWNQLPTSDVVASGWVAPRDPGSPETGDGCPSWWFCCWHRVAERLIGRRRHL